MCSSDLLEMETSSLPDPEPITQKELDKAIKQLKRGKAVGPDGIPNEAMIEADGKTREMYREVINEILKTRTSPEEWHKGHIKRLYKGKARKENAQTNEGLH